MPSKSLAVTECTRLVTNTQPGCFSFNEHLRYSNTGDWLRRIEADSLSGSYFQIYFPDKLLFQIHHVLEQQPSAPHTGPHTQDLGRYRYKLDLLTMGINHGFWIISRHFFKSYRRLDVQSDRYTLRRPKEKRLKWSECGVITAMIKHCSSVT